MGIETKEIKFIDLFGGVGGFRLGLEEANKSFRCVWYCDNDKWTTAVYNRNFKESRKPTDIRGVVAESVPDFDLLCAGFPCQSFSVAGKREGFGDTRGTLFFEIARILEGKRPALCLLENVRGLLSHDEGLTFQVVLESLDELGYDAEWEVLNSKDFGVPQNRERVFIVGHLRGRSRPQVFPLGESPEEQESEEGIRGEVLPTVDARYAALRNLGEPYIVYDLYNQRRKKENLAGALRGEGVSETSLGTALILSHVPRNGNPKDGGTGPLLSEEHSFCVDPTPHRVVHPELQSWRLFGSRTPAGGSVRILEGSRIRRLTPVECERLQSFPDDWTHSGTLNDEDVKISDTQRYKMMGNAVTVNVVRAIGERIPEVSM